MRFDGWTLALETVNFAVLVWLLHRFLYRPVLRMVDRRRAEIDQRRAEAEKAAADAKAQLADIERQRAQIGAERDAALKAAAGEAEKAAAERSAKAERDANAILENGRQVLGREREAALAEARRAALDLGADVARRLLEELPTDVRAEAWLDRIVQRLAAMTPADRDALARQVSDGVAVVVATAAKMPAGAEDAWRTRIQQALGREAKIAFEPDPKLVAGAQLRFPNALVGLSWQDAIASFRAEMESDGKPR
jgi:F-type H+-transporting ATPase subunit b